MKREKKAGNGPNKQHFNLKRVYLIISNLQIHVMTSQRVEGRCDQIGRFFALWATIQSQWQLIFYLNCPHC